METKRIILSASSLEKGQCQNYRRTENLSRLGQQYVTHVFLFLITKIGHSSFMDPSATWGLLFISADVLLVTPWLQL